MHAPFLDSLYETKLRVMGTMQGEGEQNLCLALLILFMP